MRDVTALQAGNFIFPEFFVNFSKYNLKPGSYEVMWSIIFARIR